MNIEIQPETRAQMTLFSHKILEDVTSREKLRNLPTFLESSRHSEGLLELLQTQKPSQHADVRAYFSAAKGLASEELESALFVHTRDYFQAFSTWRFTFVPLVCLHPLVSLYALQPDTVKNRIEQRISYFLELDPQIVIKYEWTLKMLKFISFLCGKWGVLSHCDFTHRSQVAQYDCLVICIQLGQCKGVQNEGILIDAIYIASTLLEKDSLLETEEEAKVAGETVSFCERVIHFLLSLNQQVDFSVHKSIAAYLYSHDLSSRVETEAIEQEVLAQKVSGKSPNSGKLSEATKVGFHVLTAPSVLRVLCCRQTQWDRLNNQLNRLLHQLRSAYLSLERQLLQHPLKSFSAPTLPAN